MEPAGFCVRKPRDAPIGLVFNKSLLLLSVDPAGPAAKSGARQYLRHRLTNINGTPVSVLEDIPPLVLHQEEVVFTFDRAPHLLPVTVLSGFLGAGKSTLLNRILSNRDGLRVAVIVNDMNEVNIDAQLVEGIERREEELVELQNGCICCTLRGDLVKSIVEFAVQGLCEYVVVESTGIGEPLPVAQAFALGKTEDGLMLSAVARLDCLVTVIDSSTFPRQVGGERALLSDMKMARDQADERDLSGLLAEQVEFANVVVINKVDLADEATLLAARSLVHYLNPDATVHETAFSEVPLPAILNTGLYNMDVYAGTEAWKREQESVHVPETEEYGISSFSWVRKGERSAPFDQERFFRLIAPFRGPREALATSVFSGVLRAKGWFFHNGDVDDRLSLSVSPAGLHVAATSRWRAVEQAKLRQLKGSKALGMREAVDAEVDKLKQSGGWSDVWGDRRLELVFIGRAADGFNREGIEKALDGAVCRDLVCDELSAVLKAEGMGLLQHEVLVARVGAGVPMEVKQAIATAGRGIKGMRFVMCTDGKAPWLDDVTSHTKDAPLTIFLLNFANNRSYHATSWETVPHDPLGALLDFVREAREGTAMRYQATVPADAYGD
eukprot:Sspe_Gene.64183::Locus_37645_Transcript_2_2_Confidence_0.667_Length_2463::g.64183::m.64183